MRTSMEFACKTGSVPAAVNYVSGILAKENVNSRECASAMLKLENVLEIITASSDASENTFAVTVSRRFSRIVIGIRFKGAQICAQQFIPDIELEGLDEDTSSILRSKLIPLLSEDIRVAYRYGVNRLRISVSKGKINRILFNCICLVLGILAGLAVKWLLPGSASVFFANEICGTLITAFFNLLKMIVAPLVFFSILSGISGFSDMHELGRISVRTVVYFVIFSVIGLLIAVGVYAVFPIGDPRMQQLVNLDSGKVYATVTAWQSFKDLFLSVFPANMLGAFVNNEILAVIFLAVLLGVCIGRMQTDYADPVNRAISALNDLMCRLAALVVSAMPLIIFCSMAKLTITVKLSSALVLISLLGIFLLGALVMLGIYCAVMAVNGISPAVFFKGFGQAIISAVTLASSSATLPVSLKCCTEKLHIPPMITYFVIPLGSTINMNGSCILLTLICLFTAKVFGVEPTVSMMVPVLSMILLLSMAAPGVPGSNVIMLASILPMMGIPAEAAQLSVCLSAFIGMVLVPVNSMGDAVVAMLIHEKMKTEPSAGRF